MERDPRVAAPKRAWGRQGSQTVPDSLQGPQETLKKAPEGSGRLSTTLPRSQTCSKPVGNLSILPSRLFASDGLLRPPMSPQEAPRRMEKDPKTPPRSCQENPRGSNRLPRGPQQVPERPPRDHKKPPRGPPYSPRDPRRPHKAPNRLPRGPARPLKDSPPTQAFI